MCLVFQSSPLGVSSSLFPIAFSMKYSWFDLHAEIPRELSSCFMNLIVFKMAVNAEFIFEACKEKEKVGDTMAKGKIIMFKLCPDALWCILN